jgi:hypothetical protein
MANITDLAYTWVLVLLRDAFDYRKKIDTLFVKELILLLQPSKIELVDFFRANVLFGQMTCKPDVYCSMTPAQILNTWQQFGYENMWQLNVSDVGHYIQTEIA